MAVRYLKTEKKWKQALEKLREAGYVSMWSRRANLAPGYFICYCSLTQPEMDKILDAPEEESK